MKGENAPEINIQKARLMRIPLVDEDYLERCIHREAVVFPWFLLESTKKAEEEGEVVIFDVNEERRKLHSIEIRTNRKAAEEDTIAEECDLLSSCLYEEEEEDDDDDMDAANLATAVTAKQLVERRESGTTPDDDNDDEVVYRIHQQQSSSFDSSSTFFNNRVRCPSLTSGK